MPSEIRETPRNKARAEEQFAVQIARSGLAKEEFIKRVNKEDYITYQIGKDQDSVETYTRENTPKTFAWFLEIIESLTESQISSSASVIFPEPEVFTTNAPTPLPTQNTETLSTKSPDLQSTPPESVPTVLTTEPTTPAPTSLEIPQEQDIPEQITSPSPEPTSVQNQVILPTELPASTAPAPNDSENSTAEPTDSSETLPTELPINASLVSKPSDNSEPLSLDNSTLVSEPSDNPEPLSADNSTASFLQPKLPKQNKTHKSVNIKTLVAIVASLGVGLLVVGYFRKVIISKFDIHHGARPSGLRGSNGNPSALRTISTNIRNKPNKLDAGRATGASFHQNTFSVLKPWTWCKKCKPRNLYVNNDYYSESDVEQKTGTEGFSVTSANGAHRQKETEAQTIEQHTLPQQHHDTTQQSGGDWIATSALKADIRATLNIHMPSSVLSAMYPHGTNEFPHDSNHLEEHKQPREKGGTSLESLGRGFEDSGTDFDYTSDGDGAVEVLGYELGSDTAGKISD